MGVYNCGRGDRDIVIVVDDMHPHVCALPVKILRNERANTTEPSISLLTILAGTLQRLQGKQRKLQGSKRDPGLLTFYANSGIGAAQQPS